MTALGMGTSTWITGPLRSLPLTYYLDQDWLRWAIGNGENSKKRSKFT